MSVLSESVTASQAAPGATPDFISEDRAPTELHLPMELRFELERMVEASYPFEACGVMVGRADLRQVSVEVVFHARNLNVERARDRFLLDPDDHIAAARAARAMGLDIVGIWHSHPDHPARPSVTDLEAAWEGYSYLIISTPAFGANDFRCWRLRDGRFLEEDIRNITTEVKS